MDGFDFCTKEDPNVVMVKVSAKMLMLKFTPCSKEYIENTCHAKCCSKSDGNVMIAVHETERTKLKKYGIKVTNGLLELKDKKCPFINANGLCKLHGTKDKPLGCISSPFTLNKKGTLIVRHRYIALKCYNGEHAIPVHEAHRFSLDRVFGKEVAQSIIDSVMRYGKDVIAPMPKKHYDILSDNDAYRRKSKERKKINKEM